MNILIDFFFLFFSFYRDSLGWAILLNFLVYVALPVLLKYTGLLLGIGSFAIYINTIIGLAKRENYFWAQVCII
jgi:adenylate cyclase 3